MTTDRYGSVFPWSGPWSASVVRNSETLRGLIRTTAFSADFVWSEGVVRNWFGRKLRTTRKKAVVRVVPYRGSTVFRTTALPHRFSRPEGVAAGVMANV